MNCFKLLAIRPRFGCNRHFLRNLQQGTIYPFYQSYQFLDENGMNVSGNAELAEISDQSTVLQSLYNIKTQDNYELALTLSAIAGKNGAGKSSLMELFFAIVYAFSVEHNILKPNFQTFNDEPEILERKFAANAEKEKKLKSKKKSILNEFKRSDAAKDINFDSLKQRMAAYAAEEAEIKETAARISANKKAVLRRVKELENFLNQLKAEVYFRLDNTYFRLTVGATPATKAVTRLSIIESREPLAEADHISGTGKDIPIDPEKLAEHFFYTIALNYSHYGLNSAVIGNWITTLFHKNDGYTTPLVLNPMRTTGNFDINTEVELAKQRMLLNVLRAYRSVVSEKDKQIYATDQQFISSFRFKLNWAKIDKLPQTLKVTKGKITGPSDEVSIFLDYMELQFPGLDMVSLMTSEFALKAILANYIFSQD